MPWLKRREDSHDACFSSVRVIWVGVQVCGSLRLLLLFTIFVTWGATLNFSLAQAHSEFTIAAFISVRSHCAGIRAPCGSWHLAVRTFLRDLIDGSGWLILSSTCSIRLKQISQLWHHDFICSSDRRSKIRSLSLFEAFSSLDLSCFLIHRFFGVVLVFLVEDGGGAVGID
jgi:hypothetical protein